MGKGKGERESLSDLLPQLIWHYWCCSSHVQSPSSRRFALLATCVVGFRLPNCTLVLGKNWVNCRSRTLSYSHSLTHLLTYLLTYLLTHSLTHWFTYSLAHLLAGLLSYLFTFCRMFSIRPILVVAAADRNITGMINHYRWLTYSLTHSFTHSLTHSFTHSLIHSLIHSLTDFIHSLLPHLRLV